MAKYKAAQKSHGRYDWVIMKKSSSPRYDWKIHRPAVDEETAKYVANMLNDATN